MSSTSKASLIRWPGLIIFAFTLSFLFALWYLMFPAAVRWGIEGWASDAYGAQINVDDIELSLSPLGLELGRLQVTDKENPLFNAVELERLKVDTELLPLLFGKVLVDELSVSALRFGTARSVSGELKNSDSSSEKPSRDQGSGSDSLTGQFTNKVENALPSVGEVLSKEPLITVELGQQFRQEFLERKRTIEGLHEALPDKGKLKGYEERVKVLTSGKVESLEDFTQRKAELEAVISEIRADRDQLRKVQGELSQGVSALKGQYQSLKDAPAQDYQRLSKKYSLDGQGLSNLGSLLLGSELADSVELAYRYYRQFSAFLPSGSGDSTQQSPAGDTSVQEGRVGREQGRYIHFSSDEPWPDVWVKRLAVQQVYVGERVASLEAFDISHQPDLIGRPIRLHMTDTGDGEIEISARLDRREKKLSDRVVVRLQDWPVTAQDLGPSQIRLDRSRLNLGAELDVAENLFGHFNAKLTNTHFVLKDDFEVGGDSYQDRAIKTMLDKMESFEVTGKVTGTPEKPDVSLSSDLQDRLGSALKSSFQDQLSNFQSELKAGLVAKVADFAGEDVSPYLQSLDDRDAGIEDMESAYTRLMDAKLDSFKSQAKDQLENKLKDKLKKLF